MVSPQPRERGGREEGGGEGERRGGKEEGGGEGERREQGRERAGREEEETKKLEPVYSSILPTLSAADLLYSFNARWWSTLGTYMYTHTHTHTRATMRSEERKGIGPHPWLSVWVQLKPAQAPPILSHVPLLLRAHIGACSHDNLSRCQGGLLH